MSVSVRVFAAVREQFHRRRFDTHKPHTHDEYRPICVVDNTGPLGAGPLPDGSWLAAGGTYETESEAASVDAVVAWVEHRQVTYTHWTPTESLLPAPVEQEGGES